MNKTFPGKWSLAYGAFIMFFVSVFGEIIRYFVRGEFILTSIIVAFLGTAPFAVANVFYVRHKKDNTPEMDERTKQNVLKFIAYASQILFLALMVLLTVITFIGIETVPILYLWILIAVNMLVIGVGSMIVMKR